MCVCLCLSICCLQVKTIFIYNPNTEALHLQNKFSDSVLAFPCLLQGEQLAGVQLMLRYALMCFSAFHCCDKHGAGEAI